MSGLFEEPDDATPLSPEERAGLKLAHITLRQELNEVEQQNIAFAMSWAWHHRNSRAGSPVGCKVAGILHQKGGWALT